VPVCSTCGQETPEGFPRCANCGALLGAAPLAREERKTVTVLFCDVTGSTALGESTDPEALRSLLAHYFERMKGIVEAHGGTVEKFIGDAVMAVFGIPQLHEDDALRACRAAVEMRDALPELGVQARIGLNTGEVVTGTAERLATGDAVNVAARLEQAAPPGEVLIGEPTYALVGDAVEVERIQPFALKGKTEPVRAYRIVAITGEGGRRNAAPMVGRATELRRLRDAFEQAERNRSCQLFTILGSAGVGKSRLAHEFLTGLDATAVRGRCLSYGEGITYWPVLEVIEHLPELELDAPPRQALASILGDETVATSSDEIAWAFRKLLEAAAQERPLVCVFDDLHWGEETFLDLVEHVADLSRGASLLLLCMARPELLDKRPGWGGGKLNATTVLLEPLSGDETEALLDSLGGVEPELRDRIRDAAEGNPLFVEEMLALVRESGDGHVAVPPTIQALLAARLDQLDPSERGVLERGAVEGRIFHRGAVQALAPEEEHVTIRLTSLVRKELVRPDSPQVPGDDAFRFRHLLIRDAAYDAVPKATRAELHERFALWLEEHGVGFPELDEILGHHLEQAIGYRRELGQLVEETVAAAARRRLADAGRRAYVRGDYAAAIGLLERAAVLVPAGEFDLPLETDLVEALSAGGRGDDALQRAALAAERASDAGERVAELCARIQEGRLRTFRDPEGATEEVERIARAALPEFEAAGDDLALYVAYHALGQVANMRAQADAGLDAYERAAAHAQRSGLPYDFLDWRAMFRIEGATPTSDLLAWLAAQETQEAGHAWLQRTRAWAIAMVGRFDEARALLDAAAADLRDRADRVGLAALDGFGRLEVELLARDAARAVEAGEASCRTLAELGELSILSSVAGSLARALYEVDRIDEADAWAARAAELGASDDALTQYLWRQTRAKVLARRGEHAEAERLAREAVTIADGTGFLNGQADAYADLGEVLLLAGRADEAAEALREALERYERKENLVAAEHTRFRLFELGAGTTRTA
jgi:class 3 adenylate cyclase/tetratricopeptide (TPR) repeat protein